MNSGMLTSTQAPFILARRPTQRSPRVCSGTTAQDPNGTLSLSLSSPHRIIALPSRASRPHTRSTRQ
eukprot:4306246-Pyramimonas_sp.AAC.1